MASYNHLYPNIKLHCELSLFPCFLFHYLHVYVTSIIFVVTIIRSIGSLGDFWSPIFLSNFFLDLTLIIRQSDTHSFFVINLFS